MTDAEAQQFTQGIYDSIFGALTGSPDGNKPAFDPNKTYLTLQNPGILLNSTDYVNPWTPGNPNGNLDHAIATWNLVDFVPNFTPVLPSGQKTTSTDSGRTVSQTFKEAVLNASVDPPKTPPDPARVKQYNDAMAVLWIDSVDENGNPAKVQSPGYLAYDTNQAAWRTAQAGYQAAYQAAMADPKLKAQWPVMAAGLSVAVQQAYTHWRTQGAQQIESAIASTQTLGGNQVQIAFADAQAIFDGYSKFPDDSTVALYRTSLSPSDWYMASSQIHWPKVTWSHATSVYNSHSDFSSGGGSAGLNLGLWSVGASASASSSHFHSDASLKTVAVSYSFALIQIRRPWLSELLLALPGWHTEIAAKGGISSGTRLNQAKTIMSLIPHAFVVVKDLVITGDFSNTEIDTASSQVSGGASVGWGPFSISGHYSHGSSSVSVKGEVGHGKISQSGMQILGWVNQIMPFSPPE